jgi:hypothetical protein
MSQSSRTKNDRNSWLVRNEIAPVSPAGGGERRPDYLEILCTIGVGADDQRPVAFEGGMVFHFVLDAGFARGNEHWLGIRGGKIDEPLFRRLMIVDGDNAGTSRQGAAD